MMKEMIPEALNQMIEVNQPAPVMESPPADVSVAATVTVAHLNLVDDSNQDLYQDLNMVMDVRRLGMMNSHRIQHLSRHKSS